MFPSKRAIVIGLVVFCGAMFVVDLVADLIVKFT